MAREKLTATQVKNLKEPGRYGDGGGLWLQVSQWGTKAWVYRFMMAGKARTMGLGPVDVVSLKDAREKATRAKALVLEGIDPIDAREGQRARQMAEAAKVITFEKAAEQYIAAQRDGWKNAKHGEQWTATLEAYAYPKIGKLSVADIDTSHVLKVLEPIWSVKTETASRVRGRIEAVLAWATVRGYRQGDNPARWRNHLDKILPKRTKVRKVKHHDAMAYAELPAFMERLRDQEGVSARALEFTILTAVRTGETIGAQWSEIDFAAKVWTIPQERTKASRPHRVPLSDRALEILEAMPREGEKDGPVFPGVRAGKGLSNMAMLQMLKGMTENGFTTHGFRSSFRDWAKEVAHYPREIAELALAHIVKDGAEAAYSRGDALEKRRKMMADWARYCATPRTPATVTQLRKGA
ncbi:MAG: integrase arm-type DNA-binding domain-containing protein [Trueperaceae bacterium]|nr:integrase arm-type DNA-binding domain-containing protein [Trueperaceae bacterium]